MTRIRLGKSPTPAGRRTRASWVLPKTDGPTSKLPHFLHFITYEVERNQQNGCEKEILRHEAFIA
jgi:hypothetical protein